MEKLNGKGKGTPDESNKVITLEQYNLLMAKLHAAENLISRVGGTATAERYATIKAQGQCIVELPGLIAEVFESIKFPFVDPGETISILVSFGIPHTEGTDDKQGNEGTAGTGYTVRAKVNPPLEKSIKTSVSSTNGKANGKGEVQVSIKATGEVLGLFPSAAEFARQKGITVPERSSAVQVVRGKGYEVVYTSKETPDA